MTLRLAARHAQLWNGGDSTPEDFRRKNGVLDARCQEIDRDPAAIERTVRIDPPEFDRLDDFVAAGATHFICGGNAPFDFAELERLVAWRDARGRGER